MGLAGAVCYGGRMTGRMAILALCLLGCASAPAVDDVARPGGAAFETARVRVDRGVASGGRAQAGALRVEFRRVLARYNPAHCDCPPFEVLLGGRWVRTWLWDAAQPDNVVAPPVVAEAAAGDEAPLYSLTVRVTSEVRAANDDNEYQVLEVSSATSLGELAVPRALALIGGRSPARIEPPGEN